MMVQDTRAAILMILSFSGFVGGTETFAEPDYFSFDDSGNLRSGAHTASLLSAAGTRTDDSNTCDLQLKDGSLSVGGQVWLALGKHACVRHNGQEICSAPRSESDDVHTGADELGNYEESMQYFDVGDDAQWKSFVRRYQGDANTLIMGQQFLDALTGTEFPADDAQQAATEGMASWFPSFQIPSEGEGPPLGFLEFVGMFVGEQKHQIAPLSEMKPNDALSSGPLALFNEECVVVLSTASSFMDTSSLYREDWKEFGMGVMGSITDIPQGHQTSMILSSYPRQGPDGIRKAFTSWGGKLQRLYNTQRLRDVTLDYLQYSTDNGAYYYYHTEEDQNYQETILGLHRHFEVIELPVRSWLLDSWWYYKGKDQGVANWTARPDIFPDGLHKIREESSNLMLLAHNRYWSTETVYAKQNGGDFDFVIEKYALPLQERFWDWLFDQAKSQWGLDAYEQDWLNYQTRAMNHTLQTIGNARTWLMQMGNAAKRHGIPIQYCMSWPRHILQSLEIDAVTQARASNDVLPNDRHSIQLGITSMFSHALAVTPYKDSFWSTPGPQPNSRYDDYEEASTLLAIIATYSTGAVAPSDKKGFLNKDLIMRSCTKDGTLLKPDMPAVRTDNTILAEAGFPVSSGQRHQVWTTQTELSGYTWTYVLSAESPPFVLSEADVYPSTSRTAGHVIWNLQDAANRADVELLLFPGSLVPATNRTHPQLYGVAPVFFNGWAFLGEARTKWTAVSRNRFSHLEVDEDGFLVTISGARDEVVELWLKNPNDEVISTSCTIPSAGSATFELFRLGCITQKMAKTKRNRSLL